MDLEVKVFKFKSYDINLNVLLLSKLILINCKVSCIILNDVDELPHVFFIDELLDLTGKYAK